MKNEIAKDQNNFRVYAENLWSVPTPLPESKRGEEAFREIHLKLSRLISDIENTAHNL